MRLLNTIGKLCSLLVLSASFYIHAASVQFVARDTDGTRITHAIVGQPFMVHLALNDIDPQNARVYIEKDSGVTLYRTSVQTRVVNGAVSGTYIYMATIDGEGIYSIGPAFVDVDGTKYESNSISIEAGRELPRNQQAKNNVMLKLLADKDVLYQGEHVQCALRFYYNNQTINPERIVQSKVHDDIAMSQLEGPFTGSEEIRGQWYDYVEWRWDTCITTAGVYDVPAYSVDYTQEHKRSRARGALSFFFNDHTSRKRVYSNALRFTVHALPAHPTASGAVGTYHDFSAEVDAHTVRQGDAVALTLTLYGAGNASDLSPPLLRAMPRALKYYDSQTKTGFDGGDETVCFEYVVQALEAGSFEIPSQDYIYFDVDTKEYCTLRTEPLMLNVTAVQAPVQQISDEEQRVDVPVAHTSSKKYAELCPLNQVGPWYMTREPHVMPWWLFALIALVPLWASAALYARSRWQMYYAHHAPTWHARNAFKRARVRLKKIARTQKTSDIVRIFSACIAERMRVAPELVTEQYMRELFASKHMPSDLYARWEQFWVQLTSTVFAHNNAALYDSDAILRECYTWLDTLEKFL